MIFRTRIQTLRSYEQFSFWWFFNTFWQQLKTIFRNWITFRHLLYNASGALYNWFFLIHLFTLFNELFTWSKRVQTIFLRWSSWIHIWPYNVGLAIPIQVSTAILPIFGEPNRQMTIPYLKLIFGSKEFISVIFYFSLQNGVLFDDSSLYLLASPLQENDFDSEEAIWDFGWIVVLFFHVKLCDLEVAFLLSQRLRDVCNEKFCQVGWLL